MALAASNHSPGEPDSDFHDNNSWCEDESLFDSLENGRDRASDLDREWQRRHDQFHTIGYRDGLTAGKEASAQEGFNVGFKQSVIAGYSWGLVRGITSALACLHDDQRGNLVESVEKREKLQNLYESVKSLSSRDSLNIFHKDIVGGSSGENGMHLEGHFNSAVEPNEILGNSQLGCHYKELESLLLECPPIKVHWTVDEKVVE
ncbi:uncharacterized protein LOC122085999 [Macadamia integrifolia]|uniref:uncharacterized protein LOC122085999 n=1 Tax=Macadamia integrifolia TaxID=60698 RepID=UPI001C4EA568|nr:uncharacterized protein LOC122085999 [Macadamia integrifolia]XP_042510589.1 uncharacterized protein LOC122085999 [Macadamia integrifolia]